MRCHICNTFEENLPVDKRTGKFLPCSKCRSIARQTAYESTLESTEEGEVAHLLLTDEEDYAKPYRGQ